MLLEIKKKMLKLSLIRLYHFIEAVAIGGINNFMKKHITVKGGFCRAKCSSQQGKPYYVLCNSKHIIIFNIR